MNQELQIEFSNFDEEDIIRVRESAKKKRKSIVESVNLEKVFGIHPSTKLQELYKQKYWQGQVPDKAKIIFLGLDANWDIDIEKNEVFPKIEEYLNDGVAFWKKYGIHHPFLLPEYRKKNGYKYHQGFSKLGINKEDADSISFIELINIPTFGTSTKGKKEYMSLINSDYLKSLNDIVFDYRKKIIFLSKTLYDDILRIKKENQYADIFDFGLTIDMKTACKNETV